MEYVPAVPLEYVEDVGAPAPSIDLYAILVAVLRRWKLITAITLSALIATYGVLKFVPPLYKSTVEILVFDPQRQIDAAVQKPISPFVDAVSSDAMNTEITVIKSKSVALRVATELGLDKDPEFQSHNRLAELAEWLGFTRLRQADNNSAQIIGGTKEEKAEKLDQAADALRARLDVWQAAYIISVYYIAESDQGAAPGIDYRQRLFSEPAGSAARSAAAGGNLVEGPRRRIAIARVGGRGLDSEIEGRKRYP
jgi:uncharacterized protein involved in exopolysaccharide biosynthesis